MKKQIRKWLLRILGVEAELEQMRADFRWDTQHLMSKIQRLQQDFDILMKAAKTFDELSPERKAQSDALAEATIGRLLAEDRARRHTTGEL